MHFSLFGNSKLNDELQCNNYSSLHFQTQIFHGQVFKFGFFYTRINIEKYK